MPDALPIIQTVSIRGYRKQQMTLFIIGLVAMGITAGLFEPSFNNFLSDIYNLNADERGFLEFPRELPGFLTALFAGSLFFLAETKIAGICAVIVGLGLVGLAWCVTGLPLNVMITFMIIWSIGNHLLMPIRKSLVMHLAGKGAKGRLMGNTSAVGAGAMMAGALVVFLVTRSIGADYKLFFLLGAGTTIIAALAFSRMRMPRAHLNRPKWIFKKRYRLYYGLTLLWGDRKQVFLTFGPWLIIREFGRDPATIAMLMFIGSGLSIFTHPKLGHWIDRFGERKILMADALCGVAVCLAYAMGPYLRGVGNITEVSLAGRSLIIDGHGLALTIIFGCYILDNILVGSGMARVTYLSKIAETPADVQPTLSMGVTLDHLSSMLAPIWAGLLWVAFGFQYTFIYAASLACVTFILASHIRTPERP
jgi:MFS family permease